MEQNQEELLKVLAKFFVNAWSMYTENDLDFELLMENSGFVTEEEATEDSEDVPEGVEEGETYYTLNTMGQEAWKIAK